MGPRTQHLPTVKPCTRTPTVRLGLAPEGTSTSGHPSVGELGSQQHGSDEGVHISQAPPSSLHNLARGNAEGWEAGVVRSGKHLPARTS